MFLNVTCVCDPAKLTNSNVLVKLTIGDVYNWVIQEMLLVDLAKTQTHVMMNDLIFV